KLCCVRCFGRDVTSENIESSGTKASSQRDGKYDDCDCYLHLLFLTMTIIQMSKGCFKYVNSPVQAGWFECRRNNFVKENHATGSSSKPCHRFEFETMPCAAQWSWIQRSNAQILSLLRWIAVLGTFAVVSGGSASIK